MATVDEQIRVLYVDEGAVAETTAESMTREGFAVSQEADPGAGLKRVRAESFDCVVSGHRPPALDGVEFCRLIRETDAGLPVVLCPTDGSEQLASDALAAGATDYIPNPAGDGPDGPDGALADRIETAVECHRSRRAVETSHARLERVLERIHDAFYAVDDDWQVTYWNTQMAERTGQDPAQVIGEELWSVFPEALGTELYERLAEAMDQQESRSFETYYEPGGYWLEYQVYPARDGLSVYSRDITDRKERERELERYETMVETVGDGVYTFDEGYYFTAVNGAMTDLTGYTEEELLGSHASLIFDDHDLADAWGAREELLAREENVMVVERAIQTKEGDAFPAAIHFGLLPYEDEFRGTAGVIHDISDRKAREQELKQRNERLEKFASIVSHDLRNPLNVAQGRLELAMAESDGDADTADHLAAIDVAHQRMTAIIEDVLALAREGESPLDPEPVPLDATARAAWETVETDDAALAVHADDHLVADQQRLRQLLENLFRNAVEHAHCTGSARADGDGNGDGGGPDAVSVTVRTVEDGFAVADDGPGIPPAEREQVFEYGYSTGTAGTGLGLSIVERVADDHDWSVTVTESAAGGARFEITGVDWTDPSA